MEEAREIAKALASKLEALSSQERMEILGIVFEGWCRLCGDEEPCYCAPCYDE